MFKNRIQIGGLVTVSVRCCEYMPTVLRKATAKLCLASAVTIQSKSKIGSSRENVVSIRPVALPPTDPQISKSHVPSLLS